MKSCVDTYIDRDECIRTVLEPRKLVFEPEVSLGMMPDITCDVTRRASHLDIQAGNGPGMIVWKHIDTSTSVEFDDADSPCDS